MSTEVTIPTIGESISEVTLTTWLVEDGDYVNEEDNLCEIESDKASVEIPAPVSGVIKFSAEAGEDIAIGAVIAQIDESAQAPAGNSKTESDSKEDAPPAPPKGSTSPSTGSSNGVASPAAKKILAEKGIDASSVQGSGKDGRVTKADAQAAQNNKASEKASETKSSSAPAAIELPTADREVTREKMTRLRKTIAKRLVQVKNDTAMLTTFNEVDMSAIMELRSKYKEQFKEEHGIGLGFMSFFTKACTIALKKFPSINGQIDGEEILTHNYVDMGIAVSSDKGLVVPVVRNADKLSLAQIESEIRRLALKARDGKLGIDEMQGGTFTITNGGIFGSMLSTPIINAPQSAILGMHNIVERPWVVNGEVKVRPIMYLALSYDHRIVDGKESVSFLKTVKELLEDPTRFLLGF